jgi:phosphoribosylaminoimidazole-succinocarboxamide synthase
MVLTSSLKATHYQFSGQTGFYRGKVRDVYFFGDKMAMVATDRISAFDVILPKPIPQKGAILNQLSAWFLEKTKDLVPNWWEASPDPNVSVGKICQPVPVEMVVRGHLVGHAWRKYQAGERTLCGVTLPEGMREFEAFPQPIITPTTKAAAGHDQDISREEILKNNWVSQPDYEKMETYTLRLFAKGQEMAKQRGLILADTKYEFGHFEGEILLMDEIHTADSSRYFFLEGFDEKVKNGESPRQLSKEFVRVWLMENGFMGLEGQSIPEMPDEFIAQITDRYTQLFETLTGNFPVMNFDSDIAGRIEKCIFEFLNQHSSRP